MNVTLNHVQAQGLSNFFFDMAKGLVLGGIGFAAVAPLEMKVIFVGVSLPFALWCLRLALQLLEEQS